jgi:hypothetical protein
MGPSGATFLMADFGALKAPILQEWLLEAGWAGVVSLSDAVSAGLENSTFCCAVAQTAAAKSRAVINQNLEQLRFIWLHPKALGHCRQKRIHGKLLNS